jgi:Cu(I)/Ag(I) efflux system membrane protein CusA/SilA
VALAHSAASSCRRSTKGDLLYMPTALPGLSAAKASELLQQTDRMIQTVPEVARVFGKAAAPRPRPIPAPLGDVRNDDPVQAERAVARRHDAGQARRRTRSAVRVPGLANIWVPPIRNRIDMLATGIKSPIGVKVSGPIRIDRPRRDRDRAGR